jgi:hypothetical protein
MACAEPLQAKLAEMERAGVPKARKDAADKGLSSVAQRERAVAAAPAYLKGRCLTWR